MAEQHQHSTSKADIFFSNNCEYHVAPNQSLRNLLDDCACFLDSGLGVFEAGHERLESHQWAGLYALRQAKAVFDVVYRRCPNVPPGQVAAAEADDRNEIARTAASELAQLLRVIESESTGPGWETLKRGVLDRARTLVSVQLSALSDDSAEMPELSRQLQGREGAHHGQ